MKLDYKLLTCHLRKEIFNRNSIGYNTILQKLTFQDVTVICVGIEVSPSSFVPLVTVSVNII